MSLESPIPNRSTEIRSCEECVMWDRYRVPAAGVVNGQCSCKTRDIALCKEHLDKYTDVPMTCENCHQRVVIAVLERFGDAL